MSKRYSDAVVHTSREKFFGQRKYSFMEWEDLWKKLTIFEFFLKFSLKFACRYLFSNECDQPIFVHDWIFFMPDRPVRKKVFIRKNLYFQDHEHCIKKMNLWDYSDKTTKCHKIKKKSSTKFLTLIYFKPLFFLFSTILI